MFTVDPLPDNSLYTKYEQHFHRALGDLDDDALFDECYVPIRKRETSFLGILDISNDTLQKYQRDQLAGLTERELLLSLVTPQLQIVLVTGDVGSGKSTSLRCAFPRALARNGFVTKELTSVEYLYIDFNSHCEELQTKLHTDGQDGVRELVALRVTNRLRSMTSASQSVTNEPFWLYLESSTRHDYAALYRQAAKDLRVARENGRISDQFYNEQLTALRIQFLNSPDTAWAIAEFLCKERKSLLVLVCDNIDPLGIEVQEIVIRWAREFGVRYNVRTLVAIRQNTHATLKRLGFIDHIRPAYFQVMRPQLRDVLRKRIKAIVELASYSPVVEPTKLGMQEIDRDIINYVTGRLLHDYSTEMLLAATGGNLRDVLTVLNSTFASASIDYNKLHNNWRQNKSFPHGFVEYELLARVLCCGGNYPHAHPSNAERYIINVWDDQCRFGPITHLFRCLLLSRIYADSSASVRVASVVEDLSPICAKAGIVSPSPEEYLRGQLATLIRHRAVDTPHSTRIDGNQIGGEWELNKSESGEVLFKSVAFSSFYFGFIKDAIAYPHLVRVERNSIKSHYVDRLQSSVGAIRFLVGQEAELLNKLGQGADRTRSLYRRLVSRKSSRRELLTGRLVRRVLTEATFALDEPENLLDDSSLVGDDALCSLAGMMHHYAWYPQEKQRLIWTIRELRQLLDDIEDLEKN
jgi:hypothetical protein